MDASNAPDQQIKRIVLHRMDRCAVCHREFELDSRPSDAIALAVRARVPIMVDEAVMERAGVKLNGDGEPDEDEVVTAPVEEQTGVKIDEERLSVFRDFINTLDLDDFDKKSKQ